MDRTFLRSPPFPLCDRRALCSARLGNTQARLSARDRLVTQRETIGYVRRQAMKGISTWLSGQAM